MGPGGLLLGQRNMKLYNFQMIYCSFASFSSVWLFRPRDCSKHQLALSPRRYLRKRQTMFCWVMIQMIAVSSGNMHGVGLFFQFFWICELLDSFSHCSAFICNFAETEQSTVVLAPSVTQLLRAKYVKCAYSRTQGCLSPLTYPDLNGNSSSRLFLCRRVAAIVFDGVAPLAAALTRWVFFMHLCVPGWAGKELMEKRCGNASI